MKLGQAVVIVGTFCGAWMIACTSSSDGVDVGEGNLTPAAPKNTDDQRKLCTDRVKENGAFRNADLSVGVIRWKCGDVRGVNGTDLGQEYCEFHAVQEGKVVDKAAKSGIKPAKVECLFTSVYRDVKGNAGGDPNQKYGAFLNEQLTEGANNLKDAKGVKLQSLGDNPLSVMNGRFNTRDAATALLRDCTKATTTNAARVNAASDEVICDADGSRCSSARDVEACTLIENNGVGWRNSDPVICGRAARGALCGASYAALPGALDGFLMTDWKADLGQAVKLWTGQSSQAPGAPDNCRYATVNGKPYLHMMICTPTTTQVTNPKYEGQLQQMCSDVFGPQIAMTAPLGLVTTPGPDAAGFCTDFNKGVKTLQSVAASK
jgi:hypothetical protein